MVEDKYLLGIPVIEEDEKVAEAGVGEEANAKENLHGSGSSDNASSKGEKRKRARGRRGRGLETRQGEGEVRIWSFNSSGAPQLRSAMNQASNMRGRMPAAILSQEHHACDGRIPDLQAQARKMGWRIAAAKAVITKENGRSAGVGICTKVGGAAGSRDGEGCDWSTAESPGRAAAIWVQQIVPCGVFMASCYLHDSEGGTARNLELLAGVLGRLKATRSPWIVGLDAQQEPSELLRWAGPLVNKVGGKVVQPPQDTFFPGLGRSKVLDYFIMDERLASAVKEVGTMSELRCKPENCSYTIRAAPHRVVWLSMKSSSVVRLKRALRAPRQFRVEKPCGCARAPMAPQEGFATRLEEAQGREQKIERASEAWKEAVQCVEVELWGVLDLFEQGKPSQKWCGRAKGTDVALRPAIPSRTGGKQGKLNQEDHGNVWLLNRLTELGFIARKAGAGSELNAACKKQWATLVRKICSPSAPIALRQEERMERLTRELQRCIDDPSQAQQEVTVAVNWLEALVKKAQKERGKRSMEAWKKWKAQQSKAGGHGGMLYHFAKRMQEDPDIATKCLAGKSLAEEDVVQADFDQWNKLWQKLSHVARAPWRDEEKLSGKGGLAEEGLRRMDGEALRAAARTFKEKTAVGIDAISPKQFSWLSDVLLQRLAELLMELENIGVWPSQLQEAIVHLIPKAAGGRRPVGLLPSLVRLWERARKPEIRKWREANERSYDWMRGGRGAERSVWADRL